MVVIGRALLGSILVSAAATAGAQGKAPATAPPAAPAVGEPPATTTPEEVAPPPAASDTPPAVEPPADQPAAEPPPDGVEAAPATPPTAPAEPEPAAAPPTVETTKERVPVFLISPAIRIGTEVPGIYGPLGAVVTGRLEVDVLLPPFSQRLAVFADLSYAEPGHREDLADPRLAGGGGRYRFTVTEHQWALGMGALGRLYPPMSKDLLGGLNFMGRLGWRFDFQTVNVAGKSGSGFGRYSETATEAGLLLGAAAEYALGPGTAQAEMTLVYTGVNHTLTGHTATGGLGFWLGYALML